MDQDVKSFLISLLANLATEAAKKAISALKIFKTRSEEVEAIIQAKGMIEIAVSTGAISLDGAKLEALKSIRCDHGQGQIKVDRSWLKAAVLETSGLGSSCCGSTELTESVLESKGTKISLGTGCCIKMTGNVSIKQT